MSTDPISNPSGLVARAKAILLSPKTEWPIIEAEPATVGGIFTGYVIWLAAIGPICSILGQMLFPVRVLGLVIARNPTVIVGTAVLSYVFALIGVYVVALIVNALAPTFNGVKNPVSALKVVAYSYTAAWVASVVQIIPMLGILVFLAMLYGFYLMYLGLPVLMKSPADKSGVYVVVTIVAAIVVYIVVGIITAALAAAFFMTTAATLTL
jgi:hypothetical protein